ncbi:MAG: restriction endonuclease subunit S [Bacteroidetes bacterium]|nr:restriction endonuclease subunit S [Bacteroidota bacterium]
MVRFDLKYSEIEGLKRLDPEYYNPAYNDIVKRVQSINSVKLNTVLNIELGPAYSSKKILKFGEIPISKIGDVTNKRDFSVWDSLDNNEFIKFGSRRIKQNEILMTLTGDPPDVGKVNMPFTEFDDESTILAFNQRVAKLDTKGIDPFYLFTILSTEYFRIRFEQCAFGIRQRNVSIPDLKTAFVYIAEPQEIENISKLTKEHFRLKRESQTLYQQATALLEQELGLDKISFDKPKSYTAKFSEVATTLRLDSNHFQPKFEQLFNHLKNNFECKKIGYLVSCNRRGLQPKYVENGEIDVINSKHITSTHLKYDNFEKTTVDDFKSSIVAQVQEGDVLIYTTGAYVGLTNVYLSNKPALASNHVNILRLKDSEIDSTYIALVLNTTIGKLQTEKHIRGSAQAELYPNDISKFIVPLLSKEKMTEIGNLVRSSLKASQQSKQLLEEAKNRVEQLIEAAANQ